MSLEEHRFAVFLPAEILIQIFSYIQPHTDGCSFLLKTNTSLYTCSLISRAWYAAAMPALYRNPILKDRNLDLFLSNVYPYRAATLGDRGNLGLSMIKELHLGVMTAFHSGCRILSTKRVIDRCKDKLEVFIAPRAYTRQYAPFVFPPFSYTNSDYYLLHTANNSINFCLAELSKCVSLKKLDLSFVVGHAVNIVRSAVITCLHNASPT